MTESGMKALFLRLCELALPTFHSWHIEGERRRFITQIRIVGKVMRHSVTHNQSTPLRSTSAGCSGDVDGAACGFGKVGLCGRCLGTD